MADHPAGHSADHPADHPADHSADHPAHNTPHDTADYTAEYTADYYGVPLFLMKDYLRALGGSETAANIFEGEGWRAELQQAPWRSIGSLRVGGTRATFSGNAAALKAFLAELDKRTQRGGG